ncbi:MAG: DUF2384 domain-containing protein [Acidobacteriia bacterium]|nr:DUF2384 domain-containing protein [Terriglobia bacterium]
MVGNEKRVEPERKNSGSQESKVALAQRGASETSTAETSVLDRAVAVIGNKGEAMRWMGTPVRALDYATPVSLLSGRKWAAAARSAVLSVPSAIVPTERIYVLNPKHPDFERVEFLAAVPFRFDPRLKQK